MYTFVYIRDHKSVTIMYFMNTHVDTRISSLSYIKLKRLDNDIKQKAFQKLAQIMKLKENQEKKPHPGIEPEFNKISVCMERNSSTPIPLSHITVDIRSVITCTVQVDRTSWLRQNNDEKFCKITKICLLETK